MSHYGKSHVILKPNNSIIYDWVESVEKKCVGGDANTPNKSTRISKIAWLNPSDKIKNELMTAANVAVKEGKWFFNLKGLELLQYTVYNKGGKYDWHMDTHEYGYVDNTHIIFLCYFLSKL